MLIDIDIDKTLRAGKRSFRLQVRFRCDEQRIVVFGPSGSGKSLTLKAIAGLMQPDRGHIRLNGSTFFDSHATINLAPQARRVAYLFQDYALFPHLTVRQNIAFGLARGWLNPSAHVRHEAVEYWLEAFRLQHQADHYPGELSGGQRQRTALARALVVQPQALLLDEPFAALDSGLRAEMRAELAALQSRLGVPMILITHDPDDAEAFGGTTIHLRDGRLAAEQPQRSVMLSTPR